MTHIILSAVLLPLTGCFTGVESTPKITSRDVKKQRAVITPEMEYTAGLANESPALWQPGKKFIFTGGKLSFVTYPIATADHVLIGDTLTLAGWHPVPSMTDVDDTLIAFTVPDGDSLFYRVTEPIEELLSRTELEIPFTVQESLVDRTRKLLAGNNYYITTPVWFNDDGNNIDGRKLVPVHIVDVRAGNASYPLSVYFIDDKGDEHHVYMSIGNDRKSTRNFSTLFSLTDPRMRYKDIKDDVWECITRGIVKPEMTRDECRLSLGSPREVVRGHYLERWVYDNGLILIFDDGYLQRVGHY